MAIEPSEPQPIAESTSEPIDLNENQVIEETTVPAKAVEAIESSETETSPVVVEAATPKGKKVASKSSASKKSSKAPETTEPCC